jgi:hypothetical protein
MSELGQSAKLTPELPMSALPPIADQAAPDVASKIIDRRAPKPFKALASVVNAKELNALPSVLVKRIIEDIRRYQT